MSTFQNDNEQLARYSQRVVGTAFWILSPVMILMLVLAEPFINWLFPEEWAPAAIYLRYFCVIGLVYCFADVNQDILLVKGRTDILFRLDIVRRTVLVALLIIGIQYSMETFLLLLVIYNILNAIIVSYIAGRLIDCSLWRQIRLVGSTPLYFLTNINQRREKR